MVVPYSVPFFGESNEGIGAHEKRGCVNCFCLF